MSNQIEIAQVVAIISSAYPNFSPSKETVGVYYELLKDLPADLLKTATLQCCAELGRKFAPSVGELRGAVSELLAKANNVPSALEAWEEVCKAEKPRRGMYRLFRDGEYVEEQPYQWSHPVVERVALRFGWPEFPNTENESVDRAHFFKQYEMELSTYKQNEIELPQVAGFLEMKRTQLAAPQMKQLAEGMTKK